MRKRNFIPGPYKTNGLVITTRIFPSELFIAEMSISAASENGTLSREAATDRRSATATLFAYATELFEMLEQLTEQHKCGCEHPACNRCDDYRIACEILDKAAGTQHDEPKTGQP